MGAVLKWIVGPIAGPILGAALALSLISFAVTAGVYHFELASVTRDRDALKDQIENPTTGWVARNAQCETNVSTLGKGLEDARRDIKALADDTAVANKRHGDAIASAIGQIRGVRTAADKLIATPRTAPIGTIEACTAGSRILKTGAP